MTNWVYQNKTSLEHTYELIFTHDISISELGDKFIYIPGNGFWITSPKIHDKCKMISMITSNKNFTIGHKKRLEFIRQYRGDIDLYGVGYNPIDKKEIGLNDYMFSVAIENDNYDSYFSEKILDCFATGTIPIYWGTKKISNFFDIDGVIFLEDFNIDMLSQKYYESKQKSIEYNYEKVLEMEITEDYIYKKYINI